MPAKAPILCSFALFCALSLPFAARVYADDPEPPVDADTLIAGLPWDGDKAYRIDGCESGHGSDADTYNLARPNGGRFQINRRTWEWFFYNYYGWTWEQIVLDDVINVQAAYIVYERARGFSPWDWCARHT